MSFTKLVEEKSALAVSLDLLGDKWTLLIVSRCLGNACRFNEFESALGINRTLLSARLDRLTETGILYKKLYNSKPKRYEYIITKAGFELRPILIGLLTWGERNLVKGQAPVSVVHKGCGSDLSLQIECLACKKLIPNEEITSKLNPNAGDLSKAFYEKTRLNRFGSPDHQ